MVAAIAMTPVRAFGDSRQDAEQKLLSVLTSPDCHVHEVPSGVINAFVASLPDDFLTLNESFGHLDVACFWTMFERLARDTSDSVEEWAIYFGTPGLGHLAVVRREGTVAKVVAGIDSLDGFGLGAVRSFAASYLGTDGVIIDASGFRGIYGAILATELLLWDGEFLHLLTPVDPSSPALKRSDLVSGFGYEDVQVDWEWRDIDGDDRPEIIVRHGIDPDPNNPGERVLIPQRAYKFDPNLMKLAPFEGPIPSDETPPDTL